MFDFSAWLTESIINGVKQGLFVREFAAVKVADWMLKGVLSPEQVEQISVGAVYVPPVVSEVGAPFDEPIIELPIEEVPIEEVVEP